MRRFYLLLSQGMSKNQVNAMNNKLKLSKYSSSELLFFIPYGIYLIFGMLSTSFYGKYVEGAMFKLATVVILALLALRELVLESRSYTPKRLFFAAVFVTLSFLIIIAGTGLTQKGLAFVCVFVFAAKDVPFKKICRFTIWLSSFIVAFIILSAYAGIIQNFMYTGGGTRARLFLGFKYALFPSAFVYNITSLVVYEHREKPSLIRSVILAVINYWIFTKTDSRLSFGLSIIVILLPIIIKLLPIVKRKIFGLLASCSFTVSCAVSFILSIYYSPDIAWMNKLNLILGERLRLGQASLKEYGVPFFGRRGIEWVGNGLDSSGNMAEGAYNYVDSFYIQIFQRYGILVSIIILVLISAATYKFWKARDYYMVLILALFAFHGIIDDLLLYLYYNTFWFAMGVLFTRQRQDFWSKRTITASPDAEAALGKA